ncbi:MAG: flavin monoamine oxidase family protein [Thiotrichales bacterium]
MNRRDSLKLLGLIMLGSRTGTADGSERNVKHPFNKRRVLVIGAGLAGLATATELNRKGHDVVVLEARDRIGGRIWTSTKWSDMPLDLGATWIHGVRDNPISVLADEIGAKRLVTSYDESVTFNTNGQPLSSAEVARLDSIRKQAYAALKKAQDRSIDVSVREAVAFLTQRFQNSLESTRFLNFVLSSEVEQEYSGSASQLSVHWYDSAQEFGGDDALFVSGFETITNYLAQGLKIELSQLVEEIHWGQTDVRVLTRTSSFVADHVVITLPLGVLKSNRVHFSPELPSKKRHAISSLGMGVLNKCYLRFESAFWSESLDWLEYVSAQSGEWTEWVSFKRAANMPILLGFNAADRGREIEAWSDQQIVASAFGALKTIFGADTPRPVDYQLTRWATDPFSQGSYSYNAVGSTPLMRDELAAPLNTTLLFAGEATHKHYFGTAHGAYLSGLRAAKDVLSL